MRESARIAALFAYNSCLAIFLTYGVFFNKVALEFGVHAFSTSSVFATFALTYSLSSLVMGALMARLGAKKTILFGGVLMAVGLAASSLAPTITFLIFTYGVIAGSGSGSMWLPTSYAVFRTFDQSRLRSVTGLVSAGTAFGSLFFAPFEALTISYLGWRPTFIVLGVLVFSLAFAAALGSERGGTVLSLRGERTSALEGDGQRMLRDVGGYHNETPFIDSIKKVARRKDFWSLYVYYMLGNAFARTTVMIFIVPMLESRGVSLLAASIAPALIGSGSMLGRVSTYVRGVSEETISALSFILQGASALGMLYTSNLAWIYALSFAFGVGYGGYIPQFALIVRKLYGIDNYSGAFGLLLTSFGIGASTGPLFGGYELTATGGYTEMFYTASFINILVGVHQLFTKKGRANLESMK
jgi:OFA family oxalate/formate antiporter-like MFS transporter